MKSGSSIRRLDALDGMRGILAIFLLCYHFGVTQLTGSWLVLNVFFVLSGFLIVRLIVQERARNGRIDFLAFYARRARRLFPALAVLLTGVVVYGLAFASDAQRATLRWDVLGTMGYFMNWRLIARSDQYFVHFQEPSVLQHAWSLSVEEQFYLVAPLLMLGLMAVLRTRRALIRVLVGLAVLSAVWMAIVGVGDDYARSHLYYGTDTRAQSLLLGAALGVATARMGKTAKSYALPVRQVQLIGWTAFAATMLSLVFAAPQTTLMADGGMFVLSLVTVAWVWATADERGGSMQRFLAWGPFVGLGRISYGAYLYHWPIGLWVGKALPDAPVWQVVVIAFPLSVGVATLSYQRIEKPIHDQGWRVVLGSALKARTVATCLVIGLFVGAFGITGGSTGMASASSAEQAKVIPLVAGQAKFERPSKQYTIALYGDSVPYLLVKNYPANRFPGVTARAVAVPGCDLLDQPWIKPPSDVEPNLDTCKKFKKDIPGHIANAHSNLLIIVPGSLLGFRHKFGDRTLWWDDPKYQRTISAKLDFIASAAKAAHTKLAIVTQTCRSDKSVGLTQLVDSVRTNDPAVLRELESATHVNKLVRSWARKHHTKVADLAKAVCPDGIPRPVKGVRIFGDGIHFSPEFTPSVWAYLIAELGPHK